MPLYRFIVQGRAQFRDDLVGFFTIRWCRAQSFDQAAQKALHMVNKDWQKHRALTQDEAPRLEIVEGRTIGFFDIWRAPNKGNTFYGIESEAEAREVEFEAAGWILPSKSL